MLNAGMARFMTQRERQRRNAAAAYARARAAPEQPEQPEVVDAVDAVDTPASVEPLASPNQPHWPAWQAFQGHAFRLHEFHLHDLPDLPNDFAHRVWLRGIESVAPGSPQANAVAQAARALAEMRQAEQVASASLHAHPQNQWHTSEALVMFVSALHDHLEAVQRIESAERPLGFLRGMMADTIQRYSRLVATLAARRAEVGHDAAGSAMTAISIHSHLMLTRDRPLTQAEARMIVNAYIVPHLQRMNVLSVRRQSI